MFHETANWIHERLSAEGGAPSTDTFTHFLDSLVGIIPPYLLAIAALLQTRRNRRRRAAPPPTPAAPPHPHPLNSDDLDDEDPDLRLRRIKAYTLFLWRAGFNPNAIHTGKERIESVRYRP